MESTLRSKTSQQKYQDNCFIAITLQTNLNKNMYCKDIQVLTFHRIYFYPKKKQTNKTTKMIN